MAYCIHLTFQLKMKASLRGRLDLMRGRPNVTMRGRPNLTMRGRLNLSLRGRLTQFTPIKAKANTIKFQFLAEPTYVLLASSQVSSGWLAQYYSPTSSPFTAGRKSPVGRKCPSKALMAKAKLLGSTSAPSGALPAGISPRS